MRIPGTAVGDVNQIKQEMQAKSLSDGKGVDVKALDVKAGDLVSAQVVGRNQQGVQVSINGQTLKLPAESLAGAQVGQNVKLEVVQADDQRLTLRVLSEGNVQKPVQGGAAQGVAPQGSQVALKPFDGILQTQLKEMGLQATEQNMSILKAQREFGLPITREVFQSLKNAMHFLTESAGLSASALAGAGKEGQAGAPGTQAGAQLDWRQEPKAFFEALSHMNTTASSGGTPASGASAQGAVAQGAVSQGASPQASGTQTAGTQASSAQVVAGTVANATGEVALLPARAQAQAQASGGQTTIQSFPDTASQVVANLTAAVPDEQVSQPLTKAQQLIQNALQQIAQANQEGQAISNTSKVAHDAASLPTGANLQTGANLPTGNNIPTGNNPTTGAEIIKSAPAEVPVVSKTFFEGLSQALSEMVSQKEAMVGTLAFMTEQKMPLQTLDILITHQFLKGAMGLNEGIFQLFEGEILASPALQGVEKQIADLKQHMLQWDQLHLGLDGDALKAQTEAIETLSKTLQNLLVTSETGEKAAQFEAAQRTTQVLQDSQNWSMVFLPMNLKDRVQDIEIYVKHQGHKNEPLDPDNSMIYIALTTDNLDHIRVKITAKKETLSIVVITESEKIQNYLESAATELLDAIKPFSSKEIQLSFKSDDETPNLAAMSRLDVNLTQLFDTYI